MKTAQLAAKRVLAVLTLLALAMAVPMQAAAGADAGGLVQLRAAAEAAGGRVDWDGVTRTVTVTRGDTVIVVRIGDATANVNGQTVAMDQPAVLRDDRTMVPQSFIDQVLAPAQEPDTAEEPDPAAVAVEFVRALAGGTAESLRTSLSPALQAVHPDGILNRVAQALAPYGALDDVQVTGQTRNAVHHSVELLAQFQKVPLSVAVRFDPNGNIDDYFMAPHIPVVPPGPPAYADASRFTEQEVVVGEAPWQLPGTLTMPVGTGPFPAVVLIHGSGPQDRDETAYAVKVFRDLAQGLASRGVAVLRYEKRTREHSQKMAAIQPLTLREESQLDAAAAVRLVAGLPGIAPDRVFILGHSLGGMAAARLLAGAEDPGVAGAILAGTPNSFYTSLAEQNKLAVENGEVPTAQLLFIMPQIAMITNPDFDPDHPPAGFSLGMPHYWADLRGATADAVLADDTPLLILQGARDWQVQAAQLQSWQDALAERQGVTYRLYDRLNHLLTEGEGEMSSTAEYLVPAHVAPYVVEDIAGWIQVH